MQIRALAKIVKKVPHVRLHIVGDGPLRKSLELEARSLKLEASVVFEGEQKDLSRFYEGADAFLLTSDSEGWGLVVLEAAAHKLPIIMTDVGLAQEVVQNEQSGFIIPVGDEPELVLAMQEFIDRPELRERLGDAAFKVFKSLGSKEEQVEQQVREWQMVISRK
jgi:glycosyltransferase involved in cell wall biosynthesis